MPKLILDLSEEELWNEFVTSSYPKWASICLLRYLGYSTLVTALIEPGTDYSIAKGFVEQFMQLFSNSHVLVRYDTGDKTTAFARAGNSLGLDKSINLIYSFLHRGWAVLISTPSNRFTNKFGCNLFLDNSGLFNIDIVGPGFDISDLDRGLLSPEIQVSISHIKWDEYELPTYPFIEIRKGPLEHLRSLRLRRLGYDLLPSSGIVCHEPVELCAHEWLMSQGYTQLFDSIRPTVTYKKIKHWYDDAFIIGLFYRKRVNWKQLVIGISDLGGDIGLVYWDIFNPLERFKDRIRIPKSHFRDNTWGYYRRSRNCGSSY